MLDVPHESEKRYQLIKRLKQTYVHHNHLGKNSTIGYFKNYRNLWQITWYAVEIFRNQAIMSRIYQGELILIFKIIQAIVKYYMD